MGYTGKIEYAAERKIRIRNKRYYRFAHWPIWIWVFFLAPGPLTFSLFAHGFHLDELGMAGSRPRWNRHRRALWPIAGRRAGALHSALRRGQAESSLSAHLLHLCVERGLNFTLLNMAGLADGRRSPVCGDMKQIYLYAYSPLCAVILLLGILGKLPRVGPSTKGEGRERRYFYGSVWAVTAAHTVLLVLWKILPYTSISTESADWLKLIVFVGVLAEMGVCRIAAMLPRTRPILPGEMMVSD